jgi:serine/threonine-protein kinase
MFTGRVPFDRTTSVSILMAHVNEPPPPMRGVKHDMVLSQQTEDIVMRCISKDPALRFSSMDELLLALKHASSGGGQVQMTGAYGAYASGSMPAYDSMRPMSVTSAPPPAVVSAPPPLFSSATPMPLASADISMETGAQPASNRTWLPFAVLAAVFVGALTGLIAFRVTSPPVAPVAAQTPPVASSAPLSPPKVSEPKALVPSAQPMPASLKWKVTSDPEGASVREDGVEVCTATPCELTYSGDAADPSKPKHLSFSKLGYKSEQKDLTPKDGAAKVKLLRMLKAPKGAGTGTADPGPTPNGFKDVPY